MLLFLYATGKHGILWFISGRKIAYSVYHLKFNDDSSAQNCRTMHTKKCLKYNKIEMLAMLVVLSQEIIINMLIKKNEKFKGELSEWLCIFKYI